MLLLPVFSLPFFAFFFVAWPLAALSRQARFALAALSVGLAVAWAVLAGRIMLDASACWSCREDVLGSPVWAIAILGVFVWSLIVGGSLAGIWSGYWFARSGPR